MVSTEDDYREMLEGERDVDIQKLRDIAQHGVPPPVRGAVWKYLLGVAQPHREQEMLHHSELSNNYQEISEKARSEESSDLFRRIKGPIERYRSTNVLFKRLEVKKKMENVLVSFVNKHTVEDFSVDFIDLIGPFVFLYEKEEDIFYCFSAFMNILDEWSSHGQFVNKLSHFMTLFRSIDPELFSYFEEEEVDPNSWALSWLKRLLSYELSMENVLRLWDTYLSCPDSLDLHIYICLAILNLNREELMSLEHSELKGSLQHLPHMDVDQLIMEAYNIRQDLLQRNVI